MTKKRRLVLHIGMGKCGSTAIQTFLAANSLPELTYLCYPGEVDANPLVYDYIDPSRCPRNILAISAQSKLTSSFTDWLVAQALQASGRTVLLSAEHISWLLDDAETNHFRQRLIDPLAGEFDISIIAYFRQPAASRYLSVLQEDAKYNPIIKLYLSKWPYSENVKVYRRWQQLCAEAGFEWLPILFGRDLLYHNNVVIDFLIRTGIFNPSMVELDSKDYFVNTSIHPVALCAIRHLIRARHQCLDWDRLSQLLKKLSKLASVFLASSTPAITRMSWTLNSQLAKYIDLISREEQDLEFLNFKPISPSAAHKMQPYPEWSSDTLAEFIPPGLHYVDGFLTGELESFLEGIPTDVVNSLINFLELEILRVFSLADPSIFIGPTMAAPESCRPAAEP